MLNEFLKFWRLKYNQSRKAFTLTEMLVGTVISLVVMTGLFTAMVQIVTKEREEGVLTETQQSMERALKYIANDLRQSVYVYDFTNKSADGVTPTPLYNLPTFGAGYTPVLAFWKLVPLTDNFFPTLSSTVTPTTTCSSFPTTSIPESVGLSGAGLTYQSECNSLFYRRKMYSLVLYLQKTNVGDSSDASWKGMSRIVRYELPKYNPTTFPTSTNTRNAGFIDPSYTGNLATWAYSSLSTNIQTQVGTPANNSQVLVDFVDNPIGTILSTGSTTVAGVSFVAGSVADPNLPTCNTAVNTATTPNLPTETRIPANTATSTYNQGSTGANYATGYSKSFFVCVTTVGTQTGLSQVVKIYLRGNAATYPQTGLNGLSVVPQAGNTILPPLQTSVTVRGVVDKSF